MHAKKGLSFLLSTFLPFGIHAEVQCSLPTPKSQHLQRDANATVKVNADVEVTVKARTSWLDRKAPVITALGASVCPPGAPLAHALQHSRRGISAPLLLICPGEQGTLCRLIYCSEKGWSLMRMPVCYILCRQLTSYLPFVAGCLAESQRLDTPVSVPSTTEGVPWVSVGVRAVTSSR